MTDSSAREWWIVGSDGREYARGPVTDMLIPAAPHGVELTAHYDGDEPWAPVVFSVSAEKTNYATPVPGTPIAYYKADLLEADARRHDSETRHGEAAECRAEAARLRG